MLSVTARRAALVAALAAAGACTVHDNQTPSLSGPSGLALSLRLAAVPSSIAYGVNSLTNGEQTAVTVTAIGPDGRGIAQLPIRLNIEVDGAPQDYGTLRERNVVTGSDGTASTTYTAPPIPANGVVANNCGGSTLGTCVQVVATPTSSNFGTVAPESVQIRLVPTGVILPPAQAPAVSFTFSPASPQANAPVQFDGSASCGAPLQGGACPSTAPSITAFAWNFGDGSTGTGATASHAFPLQQTYTVTLTATNSLGVSNSKSQVITVAGGSLPAASFSFSPSAPGVGDTVFFNALTSTPGQGHTISAYRWNFGDGGTGSGATVSHAFAVAGTYGVTLTVVDDAGQTTTSAAQSVTVGSPPGPSANFTFSPTSPVVGQQVVFDWRSTTTAQGQSIVSLDWNFGDTTPVVHCPGDPACTTQGITTHNFAFAGTFNVNLVVRDSAGRVGSKTASVPVGQPGPIAALQLFKTGGNGIQADASASIATGGATIVEYRYVWGDSTPDTVTSASSASHTFAGAGAHTVTVVVKDSNGLTNATQKDITTP